MQPAAQERAARAHTRTHTRAHTHARTLTRARTRTQTHTHARTRGEVARRRRAVCHPHSWAPRTPGSNWASRGLSLSVPSGETLTLGPGSGVSQRRVTRACQHSEGLICSAAGRWGRDQRRAEVIRGEAGQLGTRRPRAGSGEQQSYGRAVAWVSAVGTPATAGLSKPRPWLRRAESRGAQVRGRGLRALPRSGSPHARPPTPEPALGLVLRRRRASGHRPLCPSQPRAPVAGLSQGCRVPPWGLGRGLGPCGLQTPGPQPGCASERRPSPTAS